MSGRDPQAGQAAQAGADSNFAGSPAPAASEPAVMACQERHWFGVRVVDEDGKPVANATVLVKLSDGTEQTVTVGADGRFTTAKVLPGGSCEVSLPKTFDVEWKEQ